MRTRQPHRDAFARVLVDRHNIEPFEGRPQDWSNLCMGVVSFDCSEFTFHRLLAVPMFPVLAYYSNSVLRPCDALRHSIRVIDLTEFAVCTAMHSLLPSREGVVLPHRLGTAL